MACSFTVFAMMTGIIAYEVESAKKNNVYHTFTIDLETQSFDKAMYDEILQNDKLRTAILMNATGDQPVIAGWHGRNDNRWFVLDEGSFFEAGDANKDVAVVSQNLYPLIAAFDEGAYTVDVAGYKAGIIGIGIIPSSDLLFAGDYEVYNKYYGYLDHRSTDYHDEADEEPDPRFFTTIIPAESFLRYGLPANILRLEYTIKTIDELNAVSLELQSLFPGSRVYEPTLPDEVYANDMFVASLKAIMIIICGFVNIVALFVYWLARQRRTHTLYMLFGSSKIRIIQIIAIEWLAIMLAAYIVHTFIQSLINPLMETLRIHYAIDIKETIAVFLILYVSSMLLMASQLLKNTKLNYEVI
jgi:hypothetical protein